MPLFLHRIRQGFPSRFLGALAIALGFVIFLAVDQQHWWRLKPDYAFGWLVPVFVVYLVADRWAALRALFQGAGRSPLPGWLRAAVSAAAALCFGTGLAFFLLGAAYRAASGVTQPGSLALAIGFSGVLLGMIYFNAPDGCVRSASIADGRGASADMGVLASLRSDARLRVSALFLFPALIWVLSAPLASAIENAVSLFLLQKVVAVVFTVFNLLGYTLVREGNVLVLPHGQVGVADACSGIRSLTGCLFAGSFLAAVFLDRLWKKVLLVVAAMGLAFFTNLLRSLFLTAWAYAYGSDAIEGPLHDGTGFAVLGLTCVGLFCLLPLFSGNNWRRWLGLDEEDAGDSI
jgi:exosortase